MHAPDNIVPLNSRTGVASRASAESVIAETASLTQKYLPPLVKALFDRADTSLFEMADKSENSTQQAHYFDTMRELRLLRRDIESRFDREIGKQFENIRSPSSPPATTENHEFDMDSLSLVDDENLEESLAIKSMVEKLKTHQSSQLDALEKRFAHVLGEDIQEKSSYPVSPEAICDAFASALEVMEAELPIKLIIYKLFDLYVISNLGPFYQAVNELLIEAGILPKLPKPWKRKAESPPSDRRTDIEPPRQKVAEGESTGDLESSLLSALQGLLGGTPGGGLVPIQPGLHTSFDGGISPVQPQQLMSGLTGVQNALPEDHSGAIDSATLKSMLASSLQKDNGDGAVGFQQRESILIDVVAMLFDYILEDATIPDVAKAQIARLQIPMVKVALIDETFLAQKNHPARQLLNRLAQASSSLDSSLEEAPPLLGEISRIVEAIATSPESDLQLFEHQLEALEAFISAQEHEEQQVNKIITEAKTRQESAERIRARVDELIRLKLGMADTPDPIRNIIRTSWDRVLVHTAQTAGTDSDLWQKRCDLITHLIESVQPLEKGAEARRARLQAIPGIVSALRHGMSDAGFNNETIVQTLKVIEPLHMAVVSPAAHDSNDTGEALKQRAIENAITDMQDEMVHLDEMLQQLDGSLLDPQPIGEELHNTIPPEFIEDVVLATEEVVIPEELPDDAYITTIREMEVGQMVILHDRNDNPVRCKLSWKSDFLDEYVFTNWRHKVVAECTLNGLAGELYQGRLQLLEQTPILERALEKVLGGLHKQQGDNETLPGGLPA